MRDCIILGSGRSGTSMVAGALAGAGYFMGEGLFQPRLSNPKGFFEAPEVNAINEALLSTVTNTASGFAEGQRWLALPERAMGEAMPNELRTRAEALVAQRPFCFKDPRFSFTLPAWRPLLGDARFVCVFREPALTAASLVEETRAARYLEGLGFTLEQAFELWQAQYEAVLVRHAQQGDWLFLHYDQALSREGLGKLGDFLDAAVDERFPDRRLRRESAEQTAPAAARAVYDRLCELAAYQPPQATSAPKPRVSVLAVVDDAGLPHVAELASDVRAQRGVRADLVLVDTTRDGMPTVPGATVVRSTSPSRGRALLAGALHAQGDTIALARPGCRLLPARLACAAEALAAAPSADLVAADLYLTDAHGQFTARTSPSVMGDAPGPCFEAGVALRRSALDEVDLPAFVPTELELYTRLLAEDRVVHTTEPAGSIDRARHDAAWERSRDDAALVALARKRGPDTPELTVSICTYQRREILMECIEAFARQLVVPGTFELVVVNDGSTDGTAEWLDDLQLAIPLRVVHQVNGGLAAARNAGLELVRGRYVLFANDDTIPFADCVERHLRAHASQGERRVCVLGTFEQPSRALDNALMRHLEGATSVFAYAGMRAGQLYDALHFWTCNVSVALGDVRAVGGFDESFRHYGCEDTDLGLRLEVLGHRVLYEPRARALHRHVMTFDELARRQRQVARAYVRLARKHPDVLRRWGNEHLEGAWLAQQLASVERALEQHEAAARQLARIDVGALESLGEPHVATAKDIAARLAELVTALDKHWWWQGYLVGLEEHGLAGFSELTASSGGHPFGTAAEGSSHRLLAFPRWDDSAELERLIQLAAPAAGFAMLVLRFDLERDGDRSAALARLEQAYAACAEGLELDVLLEEARLTPVDARRLGRSVDAVLVVGSEPQDVLRTVAAEPLRTADSVAAWRRRFDVPESAAPSAFAPRVELSIVVPTHDRPRELRQLLERLAQQDLEATRFEVIVVDDGSAEPLPPSVTAPSWPFACTFLRQDAAGPAAARNHGLEHVRGDVVLFLNDDGVPFPDCASRHLEAHRRSVTPRAVLGTFQLLKQHLTDSLGWHVETTTALFAQPRMQAGVRYDGAAFCTGNLSVPRRVFELSDGFDAALPFAGGEDTEMGLRLADEQSLRVEYDPRIRCGHDHALDLEALVRRHTVLGWVAYRIHERHPEAGLIPGWPLRDEDWDAMIHDDASSRDAFEGLYAQVAAALESERRAGRGPTLRDTLREPLETLQDHAFRMGLLRALAGELVTS